MFVIIVYVRLCCVISLRVCNEALGYFISLTSESHREAWNSLLMLLLTRTLRLPDDKAGTHTHTEYTSKYTIVTTWGKSISSSLVLDKVFVQ